MSDLYRYIVVLGDSNLREDLPYGVQFHSVAEVVIHPAYSTSEDVHANDIGMLRLTDHATLSHQVCLVCLAQQGAAFPVHSCVLSGYSIATDVYNTSREPPSTVPLNGVLRKLPVSLLTKDECQEALYSEELPEIKNSLDAFLCSRETDVTTPCYSTLDGGSPLTCEVGGRWFLAGLMSWGRGCNVPGAPLVLTRVASFMDWLRGVHKLTELTISPEGPPSEGHTSPFDTEALQATESPIINVIIDSPDEDKVAHKVPGTHVVQNRTCGIKGDWNELMEESTGGMQGGAAVSTVEWCWMAAIMERRGGALQYLCSGALVEADLVLTTASCLKRLNARELHRYIVVLGDSNLREDLPYGVQFHAISEVVIHPDYSTFDNVHPNDIGIMMLRDYATFSHQVCSVCLAHQDVAIPSQDCVLTSYGIANGQHAATGGLHEENPAEGILRKLSLSLLKETECREALDKVTHPKPTASSNSFLCAGSLGKTSVCYNTRAAGSPLACGVRGRWFLAGLASWPGRCAASGSPSVYTRVTAFSNWLRESSVLMRQRKKSKFLKAITVT
ncbi:transmembrane protease serine 9-like [Penaeus chinensis]|uniref:transmembrane protease serine 9-like n=1 Tax=Penaeus chinensis TaxID=139456 RepID=UPI001FB60EF7|nr:transmembrane protease serine 9-like [Penaeus chinensis]